ncbi:MAG: hypothetical protein ACLSB9_27185 [Hydrogeniiclostridium mannosilyticum]
MHCYSGSEGCLCQPTGPNYESPSEVKMCRLIGGDVVGMSTACEAIAANTWEWLSAVFPASPTWQVEFPRFR